ncbi:hypothetical protein BASA82_000047 [Batrachochytrium salamandrivorans]|nr:hypothetical protein BASA81_000318 [Batrachochytrium salamandrivorans]KAH9262932.1 hypothetical protein BASA82_000047 [Batrachochytrium salamandrivorans]
MELQFDFADLEQILKEIRGLFNSSSESEELKKLAGALVQSQDKHKQAYGLGNQALKHRMDGSGEAELAEHAQELDRLEVLCREIEQNLAKLQSEESKSTARLEALENEISIAQRELGDKEQRFADFGGEAKFRKLTVPVSSTTATEDAASLPTDKLASFPQLRRILALFYNVTQIQWDLMCDEEDTCGRVVNSEHGVIKQFRFGPMDEFALANRIWSTIN